MGILDNIQGLLGANMEDPRTAATLQLAMGLLGGQGGGMQRLAGGMQGYGGVMAQARQQDEQRKRAEMQQQMQQEQLNQMRAAAQEREQATAKQRGIEQAYRNAMRTPDQAAMMLNGGPTNAAASAVPNMQPMVDQQALLRGLMESDPMAAFQMMQPKARKLTSVAPGASLFDEAAGKVAFTAPDKADKPPTAVQEYQFAAQQGYQGSFEQFQLAQKRAGATNIGMPKIDIKMGDSVAGQVGPMMKASKIQVGGAVKMFDSADRIERALDSDLITTGPFASKVQTVKQFAQVIGGGNDASIRQTQQVIRSLAQMSVEARKQLQGQGQVTETEAAAVAKADAGDIDNLTTGELRDLVTLTKRAAHFTATGHADLLKNMETNDGTKGAAPFYRVRGIERLLAHQPKLPQIGGGAPSLNDLLNKYGGK